MEKIVMIIDEEMRLNIQKCGQKLTPRKKIVCQMLENDLDIKTKSFREYHNEYEDLCLEHENLMKEIEKKYVLSNTNVNNFKGVVNWNLQYNTGELTIEFPEYTKTSCSCVDK